MFSLFPLLSAKLINAKFLYFLALISYLIFC